MRRGKKDNNQPEWWKTKQRKPRKNKVKQDIKEKVHNFYLSGNISREVPNKKDVLNIDNDRVNRHIMTMTLSEAFEIFNKNYPDNNWLHNF